MSIENFDPAIHDPSTFLQEQESTAAAAADKEATAAGLDETTQTTDGGNTPAAVKEEEATKDANKSEAAKTDEAKAQATKSDEAKSEKKSIMVPKTRLDEALARSRRLEEENRRLREAPQNQPEGSDPYTALSQAREKYETALLEGTRAEIKEARAVVEQAERAMFEQLATRTSATASVESQAAQVYDDAVAEVEATYPAFNPDSDAYNADAAQYAVGLMRAFVATGKNATEALVESAQLAALKFNLAETKQAAPEEVKASKADLRKQSSVAKAIAAANAQPPSLPATGADHDTAGGGFSAKAVADMSTKQFDEFIAKNPQMIEQLLSARSNE